MEKTAPEQRKASKSVRFTDAEGHHDTASHAGRAPSHSEALAEALAPRLAKALKAELRGVLAEETARWTEQLQLLRSQCCGGGCDRAGSLGLAGRAAAKSSKESENPERARMAEFRKEQEKLQKQRLGRMMDGGRCRRPSNESTYSAAISDVATERLDSPPGTPHGREAKEKLAKGIAAAASNDPKSAKPAQLHVPPVLPVIRVGIPKPGGRFSMDPAKPCDGAAGRTAGQRRGSDFAMPSSGTKDRVDSSALARCSSCPDLAHLSPFLEAKQAGSADSIEGEIPVTSWDENSNISETESIGEIIRNNRQAARMAASTAPAVLISGFGLEAEPFPPPETERAPELTPQDMTIEREDSKGSDKSIMTIASVTTTRTAISPQKEDGRRNSKGSFSKFDAIRRTSSEKISIDQAADRDRACMLGVDGSTKKAWGSGVTRQQSTRPMREIEHNLCAELFKAQELLPASRWSYSGKPSAKDGLEGLVTSASASSSPQWWSGAAAKSKKLLQNQGGEPPAAGAARIPPGMRLPVVARLPAAVVGARSDDTVLHPDGCRSEPLSGIGESPTGQRKRRFFFQWPAFDRNEGADRSSLRASASSRTQQDSARHPAESSSSLLQPPPASHAGAEADLGTDSTVDSRGHADATPTSSPAASGLFSVSQSPRKSFNVHLNSDPLGGATPTRRRLSCTDIREEHQRRLVKSMTQEFEAEDGIPGTPSEIDDSERGLSALAMRVCRKLTVVLPRLCGADPWNSRNPWACTAYQWTVLALALGCNAFFVMKAREVLSSDMGVDQVHGLSSILDVILALGALLSLVACGVLWRSQAIHSVCKMLHSYALKSGFLEKWEKDSLRDCSCSLALWFAAVVLNSLTEQPDLRHLAFAFVGVMHVGITSCILHICRCLANMIDCFVDALVEQPDVSKAAFNWNLFQAVCRTACGSIQAVFTVQQTMATAAAVVCVADVRNGVGADRFRVLAPSLLIVLAVVRTSVWAAAISDSCARVPMLVNSLSFGSEDLDHDRMYVVEYIVHSRAGFYIFDVRLDAATVLKAFYIACAVTLGLASQLVFAPGGN